MKNKIGVTIRSISPADINWISDFYKNRWNSTRVVSKGVLHEVPNLPGLIALKSGLRVGLLTSHIKDREFEIVTLDSLDTYIGIGSRLITTAVEAALNSSCKRIWLITTNDNLPALRFFQKRGFQIAAVHRNALEVSRKLKPEIPQVGLYEIPLRDEIELEIVLNP